MMERINLSESFEASGLSLQLLNIPEFWVNERFVSTTHQQWAALCTTTAESCIISLEHVFSRSSAGKPIAASSYRVFAKRLAVFCNTSKGFLRRGMAPETLQVMLKKVLNGQYDDDLDAIIDDVEEEVPEGPLQYEKNPCQAKLEVRALVQLMDCGCRCPLHPGRRIGVRPFFVMPSCFCSCQWFLF